MEAGRLLLLSGGCLKILDRSSFAFVYLLLDLTFSGFRFTLAFRNDKNRKEAEYKQGKGKCPCGFFKKIGCFPDTHELIGGGEIRRQSTTF